MISRLELFGSELEFDDSTTHCSPIKQHVETPHSDSHARLPGRDLRYSAEPGEQQTFESGAAGVFRWNVDRIHHSRMESQAFEDDCHAASIGCGDSIHPSWP